MQIGATYIGNTYHRKGGAMASWGICSESQVRAQARYDAVHAVHISLKLNTKTDQDIIVWLRRQVSKQGAIKEAIREKIIQDESR